MSLAEQRRVMANEKLDTNQKALQINLDAKRYGTFAEIGAGQEVVRWFFRAGGAAGTVAKTISAYDMAVSDAIYGPTDYYVSRQRLRAMLDYEYDLLLERLDKTRGGKTAFFVFANTVATRREDGPRLAGHPVPGRAGLRPLGDHHSRADAGQGERAPAGGAGRHRREPDSRGVLLAPRTGGADPVAAGQPDLGTGGGGHDPVCGPGVCAGGQPADGAATGRSRS